ncbi:MAG: hypothetical protein LAQ30_06535 [Acidobacteriia bacterium]|nr:hypothetical protein [Terriglobia bacterium]
MSDEMRPCLRQQALIAEVQRHLVRLAQLARAEAELVGGPSDAWLAVDKEIELEIGEKERSMGALRQHREEHGC